MAVTKREPKTPSKREVKKSYYKSLREERIKHYERLYNLAFECRHIKAMRHYEKMIEKIKATRRTTIGIPRAVYVRK
jgi:hypothetical protein